MNTSLETGVLIRGGRVIDPAVGLDAVKDVAVLGDRIVAVETDIQPGPNAIILDARGKIVTPGWIDIHAHTYWGVSTWGVPPDPLCLGSGVTTVVDAGTPGWANFQGFVEWIAKPAETRVLSFVHISGIGLTYGPVGEMQDLRYANPRFTAETVLEYASVTTGVKVRQGRAQVGENGVEPLRLAIEAAELAETRVMVHIGAGVPLPDVLSLLRPGDIVTHCFQGRGDTIFDDSGEFLPIVHEARERGVFFDVGHGSGSFHYPTGRRAIERGFLPDVISSDLHAISVDGPVFDMATTASKFLNMGMSLPDVIRAVTSAPAQTIGRSGELGSLRVGGIADIALFDLEEGEFPFHDTHGIEEIGSRRFSACATIRAGKVWTPEEVLAAFGRPGEGLRKTVRNANDDMMREAGVKR